jgi:hypothetical protein
LRRYGARARAAEPKLRMDRMWSRDSRQDSVSPLSGSTSTEGEGKNDGKCSCSASRALSTTAMSGHGSITSHTPDQDSQHDQLQDHAKSRSPSPHSIPRKLSLDPSSPRSRHRRQSSVHSIPDQFLAEVQLRRPASQSQTQFDRRWWTEVARRGPAAHVNRRFSVLEPIPEPRVTHEVTVHDQQRRRSEAGWRGNRLPAETCSRNGYDWTRPSAVASGSVNNGLAGSPRGRLGEFNSVVWNDRGSRHAQNKDANMNQLGTTNKGESIERVGWATDTRNSPDPAY